MYVVLGANGRAGGETAQALIELGIPVRVVLRRPEQAGKWTRLGADVAIGSIEDVASLTAALRDASGAFLLSPPPASGDPYSRAHEVGSALAQAVREALLPKLVALSSIGAQHDKGTGVIATLNSLEKHLEGAARSSIFLRPGYFVETWGEIAPAVIADGVLPTFVEPSQKIPMVSTIDVGRTAARLLAEDFSGNRIVELRGPQDWSANDVAAAFSRVLGRSVETAFVPPEIRTAVLAQEGVPPEVARALLGMYDGIASGRVEHEQGTEQRRGSVSLAEAIERIVLTIRGK
ncbi:NAD(P)H-binding protein [Sinorhizobium medicae]|uniref:NmrA family protein n=1 Tax=Sinorhizobium medicae TaxID=110321 RepID=A0A508X608_9HYPH|nr:NmrA family NAD(P)-binding protein [Sinorhizobium medicae]MDX0521776.1 NAD(P)H-binding protein [Sinorhizobium medicae]MDX0633593.1 NAD(P)H-binding protein [Sinorhizobium medicae]MDX0694546.1 NAD(P)H-binding protein [Sinorhizobium medicae]MDX0743729.1 NAD(P)H-binding protein [Sinorhizobium medicae]RVJ74888.1 NmrA family protein [Sinorhizobium medicae]